MQTVLGAVELLMGHHKAGALGGEKMPEDANPGLPCGSRDNFLYFTLPMALNYQRNSYKLWESALSTYQDDETRFVFDPKLVAGVDDVKLRAALCKHKLALQPVRHVEIWRTISSTLEDLYAGDVRRLFEAEEFDVIRVLDLLQTRQKKRFPYLSGPKIVNYWLYVMTQYTDAKLQNRQALSVAPDTHVIQASVRLGLVPASGEEATQRAAVAEAWRTALKGSRFSPIDVHTPLWLWSRQNFLPALG